jgi:hypothetical protein
MLRAGYLLPQEFYDDPSSDRICVCRHDKSPGYIGVRGYSEISSGFDIGKHGKDKDR